MKAKKKEAPTKRVRTTLPVPEPLPPRPRPAWADYWPLGCPQPGTAAYDNLPWPAHVPVLTKADLARKHEIPPRRPPLALDGWLELTFGTDGHVATVAAIALNGVVSKRLGRQAAAWEYTLEENVSLADAATAWAEAMALLGYDLSRIKKPKPRKQYTASEYDQYFPT